MDGAVAGGGGDVGGGPVAGVDVAHGERDVGARAGERPAVSIPMPDEPPVTIARLPLRSIPAIHLARRSSRIRMGS